MEFDLVRWDTILSLMLTAVFELSQQAAKAMERQGGGKIINIGSVSSFQGGWTVPAYTGRETRRRWSDQGIGQRMGLQEYPRQRDRPGLFRHRNVCAIVNDPSASRRSAVGFRRDVGVSPRTSSPALVLGERCQQLCRRSRVGGRRRMDGTITDVHRRLSS